MKTMKIRNYRKIEQKLVMVLASISFFKIVFLGQNLKMEYRRCFAERVTLHLLGCFVCISLQGLTFLKPLGSCRFFKQNSFYIMSLIRHFLKKFSLDFAEISCEDVKLMLNKVLLVSQ